MSSKLILALALLLGITGTVGSYLYIKNQTEGLSFLRSRIDIPAGTVLKQGDLESVSVPARYASFEGLAIASSDAGLVIGQSPSVDIKAGDMLLFSQFDPVKSKGEILMQLKPGERAVAIEVGSGGSVANLVEPGDFVDIIATYTIEKQSDFYPAGLAGLAASAAAENPATEDSIDLVTKNFLEGITATATNAPPETQGESGNAQGGRYTQTILQNISVLGVGQRFGILRSSLEGPGQYTYSTVSVKVTPDQAELLIFAQELGGRLTLTLRNPEDNTWVDLKRLNLADFEEKVKRKPDAASSTPPGTGTQQ